MWKSILIQRTLPLSISYILLILAALALDNILHFLNLVWVGKYLGIIGTLFLALSFGYSARKQKLIKNGALKFFLKFHCQTGWLGTLMILVHSGVHLNSILPWMATALMMLVTGSGHIGQHLINRLRKEVKEKIKQLGIDPTDTDELEMEQYWDSITVKALERWRVVHMPMVSIMLAMIAIHIISILIFWNWR